MQLSKADNKRLRNGGLLRRIHRWLGLAAALWLTVLGATGVVLDHPDWRIPNQATVPESWGSPDLTRFIRVTYMRHILVDPRDEQRWLGGSERGLWSSGDGGGTWTAVRFDELDHSPQILGLAHDPGGPAIATDDGLWRISPDGIATRVALGGEVVTSISRNSRDGELVGVTDRSRVFFFRPAQNEVDWRETAAIEPVISGEVPLSRYILNMHFGHGLFEGAAGVLINDFAGLALVILSLSGFLYWFMQRRWRKRPGTVSVARKRTITSWLFRSHAPIIGLLALVPIFYVSVTGIFGNHIRAIYQWADSVSVPAAVVPAGFSMRSLDGDVQDVVAVPGTSGDLLLVTRKGLYRSTDDAQTWKRHNTLPIQKADYGNSLNLFRVDDVLFVGAGLDASYYSVDHGQSWSLVEGPFTGISSGSRCGGDWCLKNSQGVFRGAAPGSVVKTDVNPPPLTGMPLFLFLADIHTGHAIHPAFPWVSDVLTFFALVLVVTGPFLWWRKKWL